MLIFYLSSLPYLVRLRQCISEYTLSRSQTDRNRHFFNALKYTSSFPVVLCSFIFHWLRILYHNTRENQDVVRMKFHTTIIFWIFFSFINCVYCFYWDTCVDWNLISFSKNRKTLLRPVLLFKYPAIYYAAVVFNAAARLAWILKIDMFYRVVEMELGGEKSRELAVGLVGVDLFCKVCEVFRRWIWVYLRIEREWVVSHLSSHKLEDKGNITE